MLGLTTGVRIRKFGVSPDAAAAGYRAVGALSTTDRAAADQVGADVAPLAPQASPQEKKLAAIAQVLGVADPTDTEAIRAAFEELIKPVATARASAVSHLSQRELALCREKRISPQAYLSTRSAIRSRSQR
jgi:hypothetical protein